MTTQLQRTERFMKEIQPESLVNLQPLAANESRDHEHMETVGQEQGHTHTPTHTHTHTHTHTRTYTHTYIHTHTHTHM